MVLPLCEDVTLLATGVNKVLKDKLPTLPHDIVEKFSCSSTRHCMYDACCGICSSFDMNIPDTLEIIERLNENPNENDHDYHDDQSDQPKKSVRFYKLEKFYEGKITKISRNLSVTDAIELLKQQIAVLNRQLFTKRIQASAYNEVKNKQKDFVIHVDYSENYNSKQQ